MKELPKQVFILAGLALVALVIAAVWYELIYLNPPHFDTVSSAQSEFLRDKIDFTKIATAFSSDISRAEFCKTGRFEYKINSNYYDIAKEGLPQEYSGYKTFLDTHPSIQCIKNYVADRGFAVLFQVNLYTSGTSEGYMYVPPSPLNQFLASTTSDFEVHQVNNDPRWFAYKSDEVL